MNISEHPSAELLADHHEGLVVSAQAAEVATHVVGCTRCQSLVAALDGVADILSAQGSHVLTMPTSVASSLDQALARAAIERTSSVPSVAEHRRRRAWPLLAAAAVAVIATAVGVGFVVEDNVSTSSQAGAGGNAPSMADSASKQPESSTRGIRPDFVNDDAVRRLRDLARRLDIGTTKPTEPAGSCATPTGQYGDGPVSLVVWDGRPAVAVLDTTARVVSVLDCGSATTSLFSTAY